MRPADLVLTEILLPDMNGIEVILELRTFAPGSPLSPFPGAIRTTPWNFRDAVIRPKRCAV